MKFLLLELRKTPFKALVKCITSYLQKLGTFEENVQNVAFIKVTFVKVKPLNLKLEFEVIKLDFYQSGPKFFRLLHHDRWSSKHGMKPN